MLRLLDQYIYYILTMVQSIIAVSVVVRPGTQSSFGHFFFFLQEHSRHLVDGFNVWKEIHTCCSNNFDSHENVGCTIILRLMGIIYSINGDNILREFTNLQFRGPYIILRPMQLINWLTGWQFLRRSERPGPTIKKLQSLFIY